jgi:hypothetical protein
MSESPATRIVASVGWIGLVLFLGWQEFYVENSTFQWITPWWFRIPVTVMLGLVVLVFALECMMQEMTCAAGRPVRSSSPVFRGVLHSPGSRCRPTHDRPLAVFVMGAFYSSPRGPPASAPKDSL